MKTIVKVGLGLGIIIMIIALISAQVIRRRQAAGQPRTTVVQRGDLTQEVSFTGRLTPGEEVEVGFEGVGTVAGVQVEVGEAVAAGQVLAYLDTSQAVLEVAQAVSNRQLNQNEYEIAAAKAAREASNLKIENNQTLATRRQAVRDAKAELDHAREIWQQTVRESGDESSTARVKLLAVQTAEGTYHAAQQALKSAQASTTKTNTTAADAAAVATAQLRLKEQTYAEQLAKVRLAKATLTSPVAGVVTAKNIEVGSVAASTEAAFTIATVDQLEITASVTEADAAKVKVGQPTTFTLDAYPQLASQSATLTAIDPAATIVEGVPTYQVTFTMLSPDPAWRPGLTANINSIAAQRRGVIVIPRRALIRRDGQQFVRLREGNNTREQAVTIGLIGSDGRVEILTGLSGGETIVLPNP